MSYSDKLKNILLQSLPSATPASGGRFILAKCVFCEDGKHAHSRHMYISVDCETQIPWLYCHICHNTAKIDAQMLSTYFGIYDVDFLVDTTHHIKKVNRKYKTQNIDRHLYRLNNTKITKNELSDKKLKYINWRLGTSLTYDDLITLKIILNLYDILEENNITKYSRDIRVMDELDRSFIGFISADNAFINLRNLRPKSLSKPLDKRYIMYNVFSKFDNTKRFYIMPTNVVMDQPEPVKIHIAEGTFDILSVFLNLRKNPVNNIYASVNGSGFMNLIKYFIVVLKITNCELHLYKDNDMDDYLLKYIAIVLKPFNINIYLHTNIMPNEKDFGVPIDRIDEKIEDLYRLV